MVDPWKNYSCDQCYNYSSPTLHQPMKEFCTETLNGSPITFNLYSSGLPCDVSSNEVTSDSLITLNYISCLTREHHANLKKHCQCHSCYMFVKTPWWVLGKTLNSSVVVLSMTLNSCGAIEEMIL